MRIACPNCGAQYEVPADVLPVEGRDVQCSNCGQTWFQEHPDHAGADQDRQSSLPQEDEEVVSVDASGRPAAERAREDHKTYAEDADSEETHSDAASNEAFEELSPAPARRELDPAIARVLRAEAELEEKARRRLGGSMESQPELGLDEAQHDAGFHSRAARERMARMRGEDVASEDPDETDSDKVSPVMASRRDLLPNIEEINSTLRSNNDRSPETDAGQTAQIEVRERRGSRRGFFLTMTIVICLALIYVYAPQLAEAIPQAKPALASYVSIIDAWRVWLDEKVASLLTWLDAAAVSSAR